MPMQGLRIVDYGLKDGYRLLSMVELIIVHCLENGSNCCNMAMQQKFIGGDVVGAAPSGEKARRRWNVIMCSSLKRYCWVATRSFSTATGVPASREGPSQ